MTWLSIILWLVANLPDLIALIRRLFGKDTAHKESLRLELTDIIRSKRYSRRDRRLLARAVVVREEQRLLSVELKEAFLA